MSNRRQAKCKPSDKAWLRPVLVHENSHIRKFLGRRSNTLDLVFTSTHDLVQMSKIEFRVVLGESECSAQLIDSATEENVSSAGLAEKSIRDRLNFIPCE